MYFDIHTHQATCFDTSCIHNIIIKENTSIDNVQHNKRYSTGIHPWYLPENNKKSLNVLKQIIQHKEVLAVGEIGLDFHQDILKKNSKKKQIEVFEEQIRIAEKYQKPIIIHCVKAWDTLLELKNNYSKTTTWIVHGFNKNKVLAQQLIKAGFYLSFGANIFKSTVNAEAIQYTPLDKIFLETDAQTAYSIQDIYKKASTLFNISIENFDAQIKHNYIATFVKQIQL